MAQDGDHGQKNKASGSVEGRDVDWLSDCSAAPKGSCSMKLFIKLSLRKKKSTDL
jgi:hypothetical protein